MSNYNEQIPNNAAGNIGAQLNTTLSNLGSKLSPFAQKMTGSFQQMRLMAEEKLGTSLNTDKTELPAEYVEYELKVDGIRSYYSNMIKLSKTLTSSNNMFMLPEAVIGFSRSLVDTVQQVTGQQLQTPNNSSKEVINEHHMFSKSAFQTASEMGLEENNNIGNALTKFGSAQDKIGDCKNEMVEKINKNVINPLNSQLNSDINSVMKARKQVQLLRLELDGTKSRHKNVLGNSEKEQMANEQIQKAENNLVEEVEKTMKMMKNVIENPESIRCLAELVSAQYLFFKQGEECLKELTGELDELQATQESLYRNDITE